MFRNYLIVALRNLFKHKIYSAINIAGLAIGMACCTLIVLFVQDEMAYDRFHNNADRIYRINRKVTLPGSDPFYDIGTPGALRPALVQDFPEVEGEVRFWRRPDVWVGYEKKGFIQVFCVADANFFDVFSFPFAKGDPATALQEPFTLVLTEEMAEKYFGDEDPIGKVVNVGHRYFEGDYRVTGILKDMPRQTTLQFDFLTSTILPRNFFWEVWRPGTSWSPIQNYVMLPAGYTPEELEQKLPDLLARHTNEEAATIEIYELQPLSRIYLHTMTDYGIPGPPSYGISGFGLYGDVTYVYLSGAIAFFILLIACINFMNLTTARSTGRAREVGLRKVVGAHRMQLIRQFLGESLLLSFLALPLALGLIKLVLPAFGGFVGKELSLYQTESVWVLLIGIPLFVGLVSGSYPDFYLAEFRPVEVLKEHLRAGSRGAWFRKGLVVFQFSISVVLMVGTLVVYDQLRYIQEKKLGFNQEHLLTMPLFKTDRSLNNRYEAIKQTFLEHPNVLKATATQSIMGAFVASAREMVRAEGIEGEVGMFRQSVDEDFLEACEIELVAGRGMSKAIASDDTAAFILNETAVKQLGWPDPIGKEFEWLRARRKGTVVGVVKDFHRRSLHDAIGPVCICNWWPKFDYLTLRIRSENLPVTLDFLKAKWHQFIPDRSFEFFFLDERLEQQYRSEMRFGQMVSTFSVLAIFVACLGLFGLASYTSEQRKQEIGIRKVLGASVSNIVLMLSKEFIKLVILANVIAWPVAYYTKASWLQNFAYRIDLGVAPFVLGGVLALLIALLTVSYQALKAALANPVDTLKYQ